MQLAARPPNVTAGGPLAVGRPAPPAATPPEGAAALEWIETLRQHFEKETYVAFPLAEESLPPARLRLTRVDLVAGAPVPRQRRRGDWPEHWLG